MRKDFVLASSLVILGILCCIPLALSLSLSKTSSEGDSGSLEQVQVPLDGSTQDKLRTSNYYSCDHLQELNQNKTEKFEVCCAEYPLEVFACTKEPKVGHPCTAVHAPLCCKCSHLPPDPTVKRPNPNEEEDDDSAEDDEDQDEDEDEEEEED